MNKNEKRYYELAKKWLDGNITDAEKKEFDAWFNEGLDEDIIVPPSFASSEEVLRQRMLQTVSSKIGKRKYLKTERGLMQLAAASIFFILAGFALYLFSKKKEYAQQSMAISVQEKITPSISPGGNKAVLVLGDGSQIVLDTAQTGTIANEQSTKIIKLKSGQISYTGSDASLSATTYNTLWTPKGGQYQLELADGSKVWLNSTSSLRFPTSFVGNERIVELEGEAYFEVAKNASAPFKVKVKDMEVKVLGTHFNIMAYADEAQIQTTLAEGSVQVSHQNQKLVLKPGQQSRVSANKQLEAGAVDVDEVIAWKNGLFHFSDADIQSIMRQVARWYNVEIVYEDNITTKFNGTISKTVGIEKLFQMLELTGAVHFTIKDNKIIVGS